MQELSSQFLFASTVGGKTKWKDSKTKSGVKDTFQASFIDQVFAILGRKGKPVEVKQQEVTKLKSSFTRMDKVFPGDGIISPVWRIRGDTCPLLNLFFKLKDDL